MNFKRKCSSPSPTDSFLNYSSSFEGNINSQICFSSSGSHVSGLPKNLGDKKLKCHCSSQSSSNKGSQISEIFAKYVSTKANTQESTTNLKLSASNQDEINRHKSLEDRTVLKHDSFSDSLNCSESIKEHFSQLTQELIGEVNLEHNESLHNDLEQNSSSDNFNISTTLNEHFSKHIIDLQISENDTELEGENWIDDSFFDEDFKPKESLEISENTVLKNDVIDFLNPFSSTHSDNKQDFHNETNFEEYLKDISIESSEKIKKIQLKDFNIAQEASPNTSYNFANKSLSSGALSTGSGSNLNDASKRLRAGLNYITKDKSLIYVGPNVVLNVDLAQQKKDLIKTKIEEVLIWFITNLTENQPLVFKIRNNKNWSNCIFQNNMLQLKSFQESIFTETKYSHRSRRSTFNLILYLLIKCYLLLLTNSFATQREIYYQIKNFIINQNQIRLTMNAISIMLEVEPWYFPIVPTSKGLVFGDLSVITTEKQIIRCDIPGGTLIPQDVTKIQEFKSEAFFILVVEKDAIFKKLLDEDIPNKLTRPFIIITGKGFPDTNTRLFLKKLWMCLRIPVFIMVDADPDGINIMLTYRFGSLCMAHVSEQLALPHIRWLGVFPSEIRKFKITYQILNDFEKNKIITILNRPYLKEIPWLKRELEILKENYVKAEIEGAIKCTAFLTDVYLPFKFCSKDYF